MTSEINYDILTPASERRDAYENQNHVGPAAGRPAGGRGAIYGTNDAIAANEESIADKNTNPFLLEANSKHRAKPVLGLFCFGFLFAIVRILLKYKIRGRLA